MDVTNSVPSATFTLDAHATPADLYRFLSEQPGASHVTMEFAGAKGRQKIPVMRVVHVGASEVLTDDSRQALVGKLGEWNDSLLDQPGGSEAARMLNEIVNTEKDLSLDVLNLAPAVEAMSDAYAAAHPNAFVKKWRENMEEVLSIAAPKEKGKTAERIDQDKKAIRYALKVLSRFGGTDGAEIDGASLLKQAWDICHGISPNEHGLLQIAWMCLNVHKDMLNHLIRPEVLDLLALCRDAHATRLKDFREDTHNKTAIFRLMQSVKTSANTPAEAPDSPYARTVQARTAASQPQLAGHGDPAHKTAHKTKTHQRRGSMPALFVSRQPTLGSSTPPEAEKKRAGRTSKAFVPPASPRGNAASSPLTSQTVKEKKAERPALRRVRTEVEDAPTHAGSEPTIALSAREQSRNAPDKPASSTSSTNIKVERKKRLDRDATASKVRRDEDEDASPRRLERESGGKKSSAKSSRSGKSGKKSSKESSPEDKDKPASTKARKTRRERSGESSLVARETATPTTTAQSMATTTSVSKTGDSHGVPASRRQERSSQPTHMELQKLFASEEFRQARKELETLPSYKPAADVVRYEAKGNGTHYMEWAVYLDNHQDFEANPGEHTLELLSYCPELPEEAGALKKVVRNVLRSAKLKREKMLDVLKARDVLANDKAALEPNEQLQQTLHLLTLALQLDNERRIRAGLPALYDEKQ